MSYCSTKEIAKAWGVSEGLVRRYCREGRVPTAVLEEEGWLIPEGTPKPGSQEAEQRYMIISPVAKRVVYEHGKNNHFGIYEYIQVNLAYSSCRMASNRLTRKQAIELYRTNKLSPSFEAVKVDDMIEIINHFSCVRYAIKTLMEPLSRDYIKRLHMLLTYGTYADKGRRIDPGKYRVTPSVIGVPPTKIDKELGALIYSYENRNIDLKKLLDFHVRFELIRPFTDYNGRLGRILMLKECLRHEIDLFILDDKHRSSYFNGIQHWEQDPTLLTKVVTDAQERFKGKREVFKLMEYHRPPSGRGAR